MLKVLVLLHFRAFLFVCLGRFLYFCHCSQEITSSVGVRLGTVENTKEHKFFY